jgi:hypothetical protein
MTLLRLATNNERAKQKITDLCFVTNPVVGKGIKVIYFDESANKVLVWETTPVREIERKETGFRITTNNSEYLFYKYWNTVYDELVERLYLNKHISHLSKAREIAMKHETMSPMEIIEWLYNLK